MNKKIGILTSGGDSPGMNTIIGYLTIFGTNYGFEIYGIKNGFKGLYENKIKIIKKKNIFDFLNKGGSFLGTSRFNEFKNIKIREKAIKNLNKKKIEILIVIGGEGSYIGAKKLIEMNFPCICIPGTIDNDILGTDYTVGYFTALETIVSSIDKITDTTKSHKRISILEVMGRKCGDLALSASISCNCENVIIPEKPFIKENLIKKINKIINQKKDYIIILITENTYNIFKLSKEIEKETKKETRSTSLGYIQRGGCPVAQDRILAAKMAFFSIKMIKNNETCKCIGINKEKIIKYNFIEKKIKKKINNDLFKLINKLI